MSSVKSETSMLSDSEDQEKDYITHLKFRHYKLNWIIEDFELVCKTMKSIQSPKFPTPATEDNVQWFFRLELVNLKEDNNETFKIILYNTASNKVRVKCIYYLLNSSKKGQRFISSLESSVYPFTWSMTGSEMFKELEWDKTEKKIVKLICKLSVLDSVNDIIPKPLTRFAKKDNLVNQIKCFFDEQTFKDITFKVDEKEFNAHKTILILRSPVFAAMFKTKLSEEQTSIVEIEDIKSTIFQKMLRFIYTEKVEDLEDSAAELYYAAEKYQLGKLKTMCINSLYENLSSDSVIETLKLAEMFSIFDLKQKALECLVSNLQALEGTHEFLELANSFPNFFTEISKAQKTSDNNCEVECGFEYSAKTTCEFK